MAILRDRDGIFYEIPARVLKRYAVPPTNVKQILKKEPVAGGQVKGPMGPPFDAPLRPSTIVINLAPPFAGPPSDTQEGASNTEVTSYSSSACWRRSCGCWRRSCSCKT